MVFNRFWQWFKKAKPFKRPGTERIECTIESCPNYTHDPTHRDPRLRWAVRMPLKDEDGREFLVTLCPSHVREFLVADSDFYERTERTEKFIRDGQVIH